MPRFTNAEKVAELKRELGMRRHVYSAKVLQGKMQPAMKDRLIALTEEMLREYEAKAAIDSPDLFSQAQDEISLDRYTPSEDALLKRLLQIIEIANDEREFQGIRLSKIIDIARGRE